MQTTGAAPIAALEQRLEARRNELTARVLGEMYRDPFWAARFGERGRRFAEEDGQHHLTYLIAALDARDPAVFAKYARWLRSVLTTRGMCTLHVVENLERLARAIDELVSDAAEARAVLEAGVAALEYPDRCARELTAGAGAIAARVADELRVSSPSWAARSVGPFGAAHEVRGVCSYLADAIQFARPESLAAHAAWMQTSAAAAGAPREHVPALLEALRAELSARSPELGSAAAEPLWQAFKALQPGARTG